MDRADYAAQEVCAQLKDRHQKGDYNRNLFQVKTNDRTGKQVKAYCDEHNLNANQFLNQLITNF